MSDTSSEQARLKEAVMARALVAVGALREIQDRQAERIDALLAKARAAILMGAERDDATVYCMARRAPLERERDGFVTAAVAAFERTGDYTECGAHGRLIRRHVDIPACGLPPLPSKCCDMPAIERRAAA